MIWLCGFGFSPEFPRSPRSSGRPAAQSSLVSAAGRMTAAEKPCPMCNDKKGLGAPSRPQNTVSTACQRCLNCKTCSALMSPAEKYSIKISDEELDFFKETFMMFDKVGKI